MKTKMITLPVHPVHMLWILLTLFIKADGETVSITLKCGIKTNVTSPNYPDNYNNDLESHWDIRADLVQRILITFNDFQTEDHDHLRIEEEYYPSAKATYSGSEAATPYISLGDHLVINFTPDFSESRQGFHLSISCFNETDYTGIHEAFQGLEHTRVMTQPVCKDAWHTDVADTVCREAGFPGSYETNFTSETENISESQGINYQCKESTFRLQDCKTSTSRCIAQDSLMIACSVLSELGCFDLAEYTHLLSRSVKLRRDQCLTHCRALSTTPQYAVHQHRTNCSCINQTALDVTRLSQERSRCRTTSDSQTGHYATLFNVSLGFCSEPPEIDNGSWINTSNGFMYGTTITAKCDDNYEFVGEYRKMRCDKATTSTTQDFEWHGTIPSCLKKDTVVGATSLALFKSQILTSTTSQSLGFCSEPPKLDNGSWNNTSNVSMLCTIITAKCNENYELVDGDEKMRCDKATTSTTPDFEWHGIIPSCLKKNTGTSSSKSLKICLGVLTPGIPAIIIFVWLIWKQWPIKKKGESRCLPLVCDFQQPDCQNFRCLLGVCGSTRRTPTESQREDPEEQQPALKIHRDITRLTESIIQRYQMQSQT